jgi:ketosteroid isomerase-like protein
MDAVSQVRALYEAYQARDWERAAACLHPDVAIDMPATGEWLAGRDKALAFQRAYPEPWGVMTVLRALGGAADAVAEVEVVDPQGQRFGLAAFWRQEDGLLRTGVEYWVTVGGDTPPPGRMTAFPDSQG